MAAYTRRYLVEGMAIAARVSSLVLLRGKPRYGHSGSDDGGAFSVALPHGGIVLEQLLDGGGRRWSGVHLPRQQRRVLVAWHNRASVSDMT
jgi:hypothetical protein